MAKNLIPEIAHMLGVEIGEEFKIKGREGAIYRFDADELKVIYSYQKRLTVANMMLSSLLAGKVEIVKLPWKPKKGETYFTFDRIGNKWSTNSYWWGDFPDEYALLDKGWVFRTKEEAEDALPKVAAEFGVEYEL